MRAKSIRLSDTEKWQVAEYLVANTLVVEDATKKNGYKFRLHKIEAAKEISEKLFKINAAHLVNCMGYYKLHHEHFKKPMIIPKEVVVVKEIKDDQGDLFKAKIDALENSIRVLKEQLKTSEDERKNLVIAKHDYKERLERIKRLVGDLK